MNECGYVSMKLYLQRQVQAQIWAVGHSVLSPGLEGKSLKRAIVTSMLTVVGRGRVRKEQRVTDPKLSSGLELSMWGLSGNPKVQLMN